MERAQTRAKHRAEARSRRLRPLYDLILDALILAFVFGLLLAASQAAYDDRAWPWLTFFAASALTSIVLYTLVIRSLVRWID